MLKVLFLILIVMSLVAFAQTQEKRESYKFFECGKISDKLLKEKFEEFYEKLKKDNGSQGYIINYGTNKQIAEREKQIRDSMTFRDYDGARITLFRGENIGELKSVFWIVPAGAELPKP